MSKGRGPVMFNLRVRRDDGGRMTKRELHDVLKSIRSEEAVPPGYAIAGIEWMNPERADAGWKRGSAEDLAKFVPIIKRMSLDSMMSGFRAAELEGREPHTAKDRRRQATLQARASKWGKARAKEVRAADRLKTKAGKARHRRLAERYRQRYADAVEELEDLAYPEGREYELAVNYESRKGGRK